jgi:hypothetical protein
MPGGDDCGIDRTGRRRFVRRVDVVHPGDVTGINVSAIRDDMASRRANLARSSGCNAREQRLSEAVQAEWTRNAVDVD